jgi:type III pantothenate kinase
MLNCRDGLVTLVTTHTADNVEHVFSPFVAVDIGNSAVKVAVYTADWDGAGLPQAVSTALLESSEQTREFLRTLPTPIRWRISSVHRGRHEELTRLLNEHRPTDNVRTLTYRDLPLTLEVRAPERVGLDRLAVCVAANALREPERPAVVISAGSAVTVNVIGSDGVFLGGAILPGLRLGARALSSADLLPEVLWRESAEPPAAIGADTEAAIRSGLFWGTLGGVRELVTQIAQLHRRPQVFVTGGDLKRLASLAADDAQFVPDMVLAGIAIACMDETR